MSEDRIWHIKVRKIMKIWKENEEISSICMSKRNFNNKLIEFNLKVEEYRNQTVKSIKSICQSHRTEGIL